MKQVGGEPEVTAISQQGGEPALEALREEIRRAGVFTERLENWLGVSLALLFTAGMLCILLVHTGGRGLSVWFWLWLGGGGLWAGFFVSGMLFSFLRPAIDCVFRRHVQRTLVPLSP